MPDPGAWGPGRSGLHPNPLGNVASAPRVHSNQKVRGSKEVAQPRKAITAARSRAVSRHAGLSAPSPPLTPGKPVILTLAKHAIKHGFPSPHRPRPCCRGRGTVTMAPFRPAKAFWMRPLRGDLAKPCHRTQAGTASRPSSHRAKGPWVVRAQDSGDERAQSHNFRENVMDGTGRASVGVNSQVRLVSETVRC